MSSGQRVDVVHLLGGQGLCRRILHDEEFAVVSFVQALCLERICVLVLDRETAGVLSLVAADLLEVGEPYGVVDVLLVAGLVDSSVDIGDVANVEAGCQRVGDLRNAVLAHAVGDEVGAGVQKDRAAHFIGPVVVVAEPAKGSFNAADDNWRALIGLPDQVAVDNDRVIGPFADSATGGIGVLMASLFCHCIMVDHGVHIAGGDEEAKTRLAVNLYALRVAPVGLADQSNAVATGLQQAADDRGAEARVVHIGVAADVDEVGL